MTALVSDAWDSYMGRNWDPLEDVWNIRRNRKGLERWQITATRIPILQLPVYLSQGSTFHRETFQLHWLEKQRGGVCYTPFTSLKTHFLTTTHSVWGYSHVIFERISFSVHVFCFKCHTYRTFIVISGIPSTAFLVELYCTNFCNIQHCVKSS